MTPELWRAIGFAVAAVAAYTLIATITVRHFGSRVWLVVVALTLASSGLWVARAGAQECPRLGHVSGLLAAWLPLLILFGLPMAAGTATAIRAQRAKATTGQNILMVGGATGLSLIVAAFIAFVVFVGFYGPDCWP